LNHFSVLFRANEKEQKAPDCNPGFSLPIRVVELVLVAIFENPFKQF